MHAGHLLVVLGGVASAIFVGLAAWIISTRKQSKLYQVIAKQETTKFEAFNATVQTVREQTAASLQIQEQSEQTVLEPTQLEQTMLDDDFDPYGHQTGMSGLLKDQMAESPTAQTPTIISGIDWTPLVGYYEFITEIKGGGMGRIFKARKTNTGNEWIVKFIPNNVGEISSETDLLKELNHVSLPAVIDIFDSVHGQFLVQSFIEGVGMDQAIKARAAETPQDPMPVLKVIDWAGQLGQVLHYLHTLPEPLLHLDLKPSNVMVTHGDKLVLIDFGISRKQSDVTGAVGATLSYAAPEQLKKSPKDPKAQEIIARRFGELPAERSDWQLSTRTDIYSMGVMLYELATGHIPQVAHMHRLKQHVPSSLARIIYKCLEINPADRYASIAELLADLEQAGKEAHRVNTTLRARKAAKFASAASVGIATFGFIMGANIIQLEAVTLLSANPNILTVSLMQSTELDFSRFLPDSDQERPFNPNNLSWTIDQAHLVQIDGKRMLGLNLGETAIHATYRNSTVTIQVQVVEPMDGVVDIVQRFATGAQLSVLTGTTNRQRHDGPLATAEFVAPESLALADSGAIYLVDAGVLRQIYNGQVSTIDIQPAFLTAAMVRVSSNDIFVLTDAWYDEGGFYYGIIRITDQGAEGFYLGDAIHTSIRDFFVTDNYIYKLVHNAGTEQTYLATINLADSWNVSIITQLPLTTSAMTPSQSGIFFADSTEGTIFYYGDGAITHIAGLSGQRHFIDGTAPLFYQPQRLAYTGDALYVWDFNTLRRIDLANGIATQAVSVAGQVSPTYDLSNIATADAHATILPYSILADFLYTPDGLIISDPKRGVLWAFVTNM